jgi:SsrA-binding protein
VLAENRKARFDYEIVESFEAGLELTGAETKSVRGGGVGLTGARVVFREDGAFVVGMSIPKYKFDSSDEYEPLRTRRLLLHREEIVSLGMKMRSAGLTCIPVKLYNKGSLIKLQIALVRGKKRFEKRELIKKREAEIGLARRLKISR